MEIIPLEKSVQDLVVKLLQPEPGIQIKVLGHVLNSGEYDIGDRHKIRSYVTAIYGGNIGVIPLNPREVSLDNLKSGINPGKPLLIVYRHTPEYDG